MPGTDKDKDDFQFFPILRGESVGVSGEFTGYVYIVSSPENLKTEWTSNQIAVLCKDLEGFFLEHPGEVDNLLGSVGAVLSEFDEPIGVLSASAYESESICLVKVRDAVRVLENEMHIRIVATESQGDVFFID
ncbi:MAG: hypothetical protein EAX95_09140 [Candidatus Thorarchaeota archaeon]|nr:hypothetical protein [Candidatus Thorarchaeota archaeon]